MTYKYISFSIAITFISFLVGMAVNSLLKKTKFYDNELSNLNFVKSEKLNQWLGVDLVKWMVKNTPFKYLNQKLKLNNTIEKADLHQLRQEMTSSEIDHLIGFVFVTIFALLKVYKSEWLFALTIMIVNILMNLHPSLLQQQNKRRIDKILSRTNRRR
ncbi:MAG: hypothetical protein IPP30_02120 [Flavobacterium sp.]|nr:hypothetical protein [Flavobacterium sp.]